MGAGNASVTQNLTGLDGRLKRTYENKTTFDIGVSLGYQHYFGESQNHGIKTNLGFGGGVPPFKGEVQDKIVRLDSTGLNNTRSYDFSPLKTSLEVSYLWDFFNRGDHTIGLEVGLGYEMGIWIGKNKERVWGQMPTEAGYVDMDDSKSETFAMLTHAIYPKIGLHYYYGNHQFNVAYKFGGILDGIKGERKSDVNIIGFKSGITQTIQSSPSYISFGYSYRF